ncbi:hypothetical protein MSP7336_02687 [Mycobacterium shimoidei]|uniref:Uncharacterized protein n=1 Tax=Mycobacterium shimoidei TaxID=29313 RepID=A0A375YZS1_MYCSH|nr:hypothetical protein [Mycobacterium shimoidei]SRX94433.1 hypothetical protein MSP7336_02687 [Mycobacterium shimoidei]
MNKDDMILISVNDHIVEPPEFKIHDHGGEGSGWQDQLSKLTINTGGKSQD